MTTQMSAKACLLRGISISGLTFYTGRNRNFGK
nr:MAG TPA: hypothetical protein [Caudoviricetes sp.]